VDNSSTSSEAEKKIEALQKENADLKLELSRIKDAILDARRAAKEDEHMYELNQKLEYHVNNSPLAVIEWGPDLRLIRWSGEAEHIFGWKAEEVLGKKMDDFPWIYKEDIGQVEEVTKDLTSGTEMKRFSENRNYTKDGSVLYCQWYNSSLIDKSGKLQSIMSLVLDITKRKLNEQRLSESEKLYRTIGETIDYGIWITDPDGRNVYASESFLRLVGITQQECSDFGWGDVLHPDDSERTIEAWKQCAKTGNFWDIEHRYKGVDGQYHPILARGLPVRDEKGKIIYWAGINLDISNLKKAEAQIKKSLEEKEVLLKEIHHRVKNNLQLISSLLSLQSMNSDEKVKQSLNESKGRIRSISLVHEILYETNDFSNIEAPRYFNDLGRNILAAYGREKVKLAFHVEKISLDLTTAIPCGIILNELMTNSIKYAFPHGDGSITVSFKADQLDHVLNVTDDGIGLPQGFDQKNTLGIKLINTLASQLSGSVKYGNEKGASITLRFPSK
jgi:PAS domain S-box-containing protein